MAWWARRERPRAEGEDDDVAGVVDEYNDVVGVVGKDEDAARFMIVDKEAVGMVVEH